MHMPVKIGGRRCCFSDLFCGHHLSFVFFFYLLLISEERKKAEAMLIFLMAVHDGHMHIPLLIAWTSEEGRHLSCFSVLSSIKGGTQRT